MLAEDRAQADRDLADIALADADAKLIELTVRNLRDIAPTYYFNVPKGYEVLAAVFAQRRRPEEEFL